MKIIILGAGRVGESVADSLVSERNDITVIDTDARRLRELESRFDLRGVVGNGIEPAVLAEAGARDTDLLIACAALDETNLVCCKVAQRLFSIPTRIARVRSAGFQDDALMGHGRPGSRPHHLPRRVAHTLHRQAHRVPRGHAGARVCRGASLPGGSARPRGRAAGQPCHWRTARDACQTWTCGMVAIYRRFLDEPDRFVACDGETRVEPGDEVFVLAASDHIAQVIAALHRRGEQAAHPVRRIMIAGGGRVGLRLAQQLAEVPGRFQVKIIEDDPDRCIELASTLPSEVLVLQGDATDEDLLTGRKRR